MDELLAPSVPLRTPVGRRTWPRLSALLATGALLALGLFGGAPLAGEGEEPPAPFEFLKHTGDLYKEKMNWRQQWIQDDAGKMSAAAEAAVKIATAKGYSRKKLKAELKDAGREYAPLSKNLDVGRHQLVKWLFARAIERANKELAAQGLQTIDRVTSINSGGTGDYTRDQDLTVFALDDARETALFTAMRDIAKDELHLVVEEDPKLGVKAGINIPDIEVAFHRGVNDLPDPRYASDVQTFALDYRKAIEKQSRNPEAYFGYGFEVEVQGRRYLSFKPGQTLVQTFEVQGGKVRYTGQVASCQREARAILRGAIGQRYRRAQCSVHIVNDYLQAFRHEQHEGADPTKGALKYAGRSLEQLCSYHGYKPWNELLMADRVELLAKIFPPGYLDLPGGRGRLEYMAKALDVAYLTFLGKALPERVDGPAGKKPTTHPGEKLSQASAEGDARIAMIFMHKAAAATASAVAAEMLDPPALSPEFLRTVNAADSEWNRMSPAEREARARQQDANYRKCVSIAAMENMLATVEQIKLLDLPEFNRKGTTPGTDGIRRMLEAADERTRPLLEIAAEHADASIRAMRAQSPEARAQAEADMAAARAKLEAKLGREAPGKRVIEAAASAGPRQFVKDRTARKPGPWGQAVEETRARLKEHIEEAFPPRDYQAFREQLRKKGVRGYLGQQVLEEAFQAGNIVDGLTLIEMYQNGADYEAYKHFLTVNLLSRVYWGMGFLIQAKDVQTLEDLKLLGQNIVFDAFSRLVPGVGTAKIIFDIERGLVVVTVGWAINQANADLIDALYTGEAGRHSDKAAGTVGGRIRDSGVCVLPAQFVLRKADENGGVSIGIDQSGLYRYCFEQLVTRPSGRRTDYDEIGSRPLIPGDPGKFAQAHDRLARLLLRASAAPEPEWFGESAPARFDQRELDEAMLKFREELARQCRPMTDRVINELAPRQYFDANGQDVIAAGLHSRLVNDALAGMLATWQTHKLENQLARRQVSYMAKLADWRGMAEELFRTPPGAAALPQCELEIGFNLPDPQAVQDASDGLPISVVLRAPGDFPGEVRDVRLEVEPAPFELPAGEKEARPGTVITQKFKVKAVADDGAGPVLAEKELVLKVRLPDDPIAVMKRARHVAVGYSGPVHEVKRGGSGPYDRQKDAGSTSLELDPFRSGPPGKVNVQWSGSRFTVTEDEEVKSPGDSSSTSTRRVRLSGSVNLTRRTLTLEISTEQASTVVSNPGTPQQYSQSNSHGGSMRIVDIPMTSVGQDFVVFEMRGRKQLAKAGFAIRTTGMTEWTGENGRKESYLTEAVPQGKSDSEPVVTVKFDRASAMDFIDELQKRSESGGK